MVGARGRRDIQATRPDRTHLVAFGRLGTLLIRIVGGLPHGNPSRPTPLRGAARSGRRVPHRGFAMNSPSAIALTAFIAWALLLLVLMEIIRSQLVVRGKVPDRKSTRLNSSHHSISY